MNVEFRAITNRAEILERSVIKSSVMPSAKFSCSGSLDMLVKGNTAIEGLFGSGSCGLNAGCQGWSHATAPITPRTTIKTAAIAGHDQDRARHLWQMVFPAA